ncbi:MAG TPA: hypothetical protein VFD13_02635 [Candidatus Kapabacteria bacterium]|nr:hypothetical protein [Candidatus Kapabacteria bacterium]
MTAEMTAGMTARWLLPRLVLAALFLSGAAFAFFESVYLRDQYTKFRVRRIAGWKWAFRAIALGLSVSFIALMAAGS